MNNDNTMLRTFLWCGLFAANFVFIGLVLYLPPNPISTDPYLAQLGLVAGVMALALSFFLPKIIKNTPPLQNYILGLALNEQTAVLGFLTSYIFGNNQFAYALFGLSIIGFVLRFPKEKRLQSKIDV